MKIGDSAIVTTCSGQYRGKIRAFRQFGFEPGDHAYEVHGHGITTITRRVIKDDGRKLLTGPTCRLCSTRPDCAFREAL